MRVVMFESNPELGEALETRLSAEGHAVTRLAAFDPDVLTAESGERTVVLLDAEVTGAATPWAVRALRERDQRALVVVLGASVAAEDRIRAFEHGADDYLHKPLTPEELAARLRALARRTDGPSRGELAAGTLRLDPVRRRASLPGKDVSLTGKEYAVLAVLVSSGERLVTRAELERHLYGLTGEPGSNSVEVHIHNLRRKLGERLIRNIRGRGYRVEC